MKENAQSPRRSSSSALAFLQCLAITTVQKERDTEEGVRFLHELLDLQIAAAQKHRAQGIL